MKKWFSILFTIISLIVGSLLTKEAVNALMTIVANYESLSLTVFASFPLFFATGVAFVLSFIFIVIASNHVGSSYTLKRYSVTIIILSALGIASSVFSAVAIFHSLVGATSFMIEPLSVLVLHSVFLFLGIMMYLHAKKIIKDNDIKDVVKKPLGITFLKYLGYVTLMIFAGSYLGAFIKLPAYVSDNSWMILPFYIQLTVPAIELFIYVFLKYFQKDSNKRSKIVFVSSITLFVVSVVGLILTLVVYNYNSIKFVSLTSPFLQIERLIKFPLCFLLIYLVSMILPLLNFVVGFVKILMKKKNSVTK